MRVFRGCCFWRVWGTEGQLLLLLLLSLLLFQMSGRLVVVGRMRCICESREAKEPIFFWPMFKQHWKPAKAVVTIVYGTMGPWIKSHSSIASLPQFLCITFAKGFKWYILSRLSMQRGRMAFARGMTVFFCHLTIFVFYVEGLTTDARGDNWRERC